MGPSPAKVESGPPKIIEAAVELVLPPACRESVVGDLCERYTSPGRYLREAALTVPLVILSRILRTTDAALLFLEACALFLSFVAAARFYNDGIFFGQQNVYLRMAPPVVLALVGLVLVDAYAPAAKRMIMGPAAAFCAIWLQFSVMSRNADWTLPIEVVLSGSLGGVLMVAGLRALFTGGDSRTSGAG